MTSRDAGRWIRDRGLTLVLLSMFALFLMGQLRTGFAVYNAEQHEHGRPLVTLNTYLGTGHPWEALFDYLTSSRFWFESLQNWQSEFLAIASMVWLAVYLRQRWSPESKPVHAPHAETGR